MNIRACSIDAILRLLPLGALFSILILALYGCAHYSSANKDISKPVSVPAPIKAESPIKAGPEAASGYAPKPGWFYKRYAVAAANPLAAQAGADILKAGGSAVDAAIAVQMVLTLVEPQSSGIGGGAFLMHFDGKQLEAYDGRETAPALADENLFVKDAKPLAFHEAVVGGRSVGVPGVLRLLELAHKQHGKLSWKRLFEPAIQLADEGFALSPRLHTLLASEKYLAKADAQAAAYFYEPDGKPKAVGTWLINRELAITLREIAEQGAKAFYEGPIAADIVAKVTLLPGNPGKLSPTDMGNYAAKRREPVCTVYRVQYRVCGMPPPSSGGIAIAQILGMLEPRNIAASSPIKGVPTEDALHLMAEIDKRAYADRGQYVADTDYIPLPGNSIFPIINNGYLIDRGASISTQSSGKASAGEPARARVSYAPDASLEPSGTSHISIVDDYGNALAMTTTIEDQFGARQMVRGFLLNNQLTDFSFVAAENGKAVANRVQPGKRPRSSMSPVLVLDAKTNELLMTLGSPGGSAIINYVAKVLVGTLDWGLDMQRAIDLPNFGSRNLGSKGTVELEKGRFPQATIEALRARGHEVVEIEQTSGLQGIMRIKGSMGSAWFGGADPRREGVVAGE